MPRWFRRSAHLLVAVGLISLSSPAAGQDVAAAEALFNQGLADMNAGRYETGCKAIAESQRLDPQPGTLFTLAACEAQRGRIATAVAYFNDYLSLYDRMTRAEKARQRRRADVARQERDRLSPRVPKLALSLPPDAPPGTEVKRDGYKLGEAALGIALPVDPGEHVVSIQVPGGPVREQRITLAEGETKEISLAVNPAPAPTLDVPESPVTSPTPPPRTAPTTPPPQAAPIAPPPQAAPTTPPAPAPTPNNTPPSPPDAPSAPTGRRTAVYVAGGVGVAGLVLSGITGALVLGKKGVVDDHCGKAIQAPDAKACDQTGLDAANSGNSMAVVSTIAFGVGLAGLGTAAVLYWTEPTPSAAAAGQAPRRLTAGVLELGPTGAMFGAQGTF